jgi:Ran GTPase-activating protein (RanGAP) involved in mRNA processing and transport
LNLKDKPNKLIKAAFKLIKNYDIRAVDFTNAGMHDDSIRLLSSYLKENPNLRSVILDCNTFTDDGLQKLTETLRDNSKLAHMSIRECPHISNKGLESLCEVISMTNTVLFQVDLDMYQFDQDLALTVLTESALNRDIQEQLKPVKERCYFDEEGRPIERPPFEPSRGANNMSKMTN